MQVRYFQQKRVEVRASAINNSFSLRKSQLQSLAIKK